MSEHCHHHEEEQCCSCHCHEHHHHDHETFSEQLIHVADDAWMEVLHDKMKKHIEAQSGKQIDALAKLVTEENESRWQQKTKNTHQIHEFRDRVAAFFKKK